MSDIKACFPSRFEGGMILESDFSQLEIVALAALSRDAVLIEDMLSGKDMHRFFTAERLKIPEEEVQSKDRTNTKRMTFLIQYGGGAATLARKIGLPQEECKAFIDAYYNRYWEVKLWQDEVAAEVERSRKPSGKLSPKGFAVGRGEWESPLGRLYVFFEQDPPEWMRSEEPNFSPTQMKNYMVQGTATGDIMAVFRARLYRRLVGTPLFKRCLLINTVHDSVMADCMSMEDALQLKTIIDEIASSLVDVLAETWGFICPVPFKVETKIGPKWSDLEKI